MKPGSETNSTRTSKGYYPCWVRLDPGWPFLRRVCPRAIPGTVPRPGMAKSGKEEEGGKEETTFFLKFEA